MYRLPCGSRRFIVEKQEATLLSLDQTLASWWVGMWTLQNPDYCVNIYIYTHTSFTRCMHWYLAPALIVWTGNGDHRPAQLDFQRVTLGPPGDPQETPKQLPGSPRTLLALTVAAGVSSLPQAAVQSAGWGASQRGARNQNALGCPGKHEKSLRMFQVFKWLWM